MAQKRLVLHQKGTRRRPYSRIAESGQAALVASRKLRRRRLVRRRETKKKEKMKRNMATLALACAPLALAGEKVEYPTENVAQFVVEKLDATSLTPVLKLKKEKALAQYKYSTEQITEKEAIVASGGRSLRLTVLEQSRKGIYLCVSEPGRDGAQPKMQSVVLVKRTDARALLLGRMSWMDFVACPVIGGESSGPSGSYD
jgi:hypothetical protein